MTAALDIHFSRVAGEYRRLRTTDAEPISFIASKLTGEQRLNAADVGCGAGRYSLMLCEALGDQFSLYCCDKNHEMLQELEGHLQSNGIQRFTIVNSSAENIPIESDTLNAMFTFNAIHHFKLKEFFQECSRLLIDQGQLFVYTRLNEQNNESIWGKYFPGFLRKESRLYQQGDIEEGLSKAVGLDLKSVTKFPYKRSVSLERLTQLVKQRHYSTFSLYNDNELTEALGKFENNIRTEFSDTTRICWEDENIMYHIGNCK